MYILLMKTYTISFNKLHKIIPFLIVSIVINFTNKVSGQSSDMPNMNMGTSASGHMILWLEAFIMIAFAVSLFFYIKSQQKLGNSIISMPFIYMSFGIILLIFARLFLLLNEFEVYDINLMTVRILWHLFIYIAMITFFIAINKVNDRTKDKELNAFSKIDLAYFISTLSIVVFLFLTPETFGVSLMKRIMGTKIPDWGLLHFLAFILTGVLTFRMITVLNAARKTPVGTYMQSMSSSFLIFLIITTINHLISLLTTSWEWFTVDTNIIELSEQIFWLIGVSFLAYGFSRLFIIVSGTESYAESKIEEESSENGYAKTIMEILSNHIGSLATKISTQSSRDSGIKLIDINPENVKDFANAVQLSTSGLIGEFPSKYLSVSIQNSVQKA